MIKSMTGFGRKEFMNESRKITVELKAVNHRYLDVNMKMPKKLNFFDSAIRNLLKEYVQRGKLDVYITYEDYTEGKMSVKFNEDVAREYLNHLNAMEELFHLENDVRVSHLSRYPEVLVMEEQSIDEDEKNKTDLCFVDRFVYFDNDRMIKLYNRQTSQILY